MIKHATADTFVFCRSVGPQSLYHIGLIEHPLWGKWVTPGGHVEPHENSYEAAQRELAEEAGITSATFLPPPGFRLPRDFPPDRFVSPPWYVTEMLIPADNGSKESHFHTDFQYVAVVDMPNLPGIPQHRFAWYRREHLGDLFMFGDALATAHAIFDYLEQF